MMVLAPFFSNRLSAQEKNAAPVNAITSVRDTILMGTQPPAELIYTSLPASSTTASSAAVYSRDILKSPVTNVKNTLTGRLAGLYSLQGSGQPGADGVTLSLRGQEPIVIIDGIVANLTTFDL